MEITLKNYLNNPPDFSGQSFNGLPLIEEHFMLDCVRESIPEDIKRFFTSMGYNVVDGEIQETFRIMQGEEEILAVVAYTLMGAKNKTYVTVTLWK